MNNPAERRRMLTQGRSTGPTTGVLDGSVLRRMRSVTVTPAGKRSKSCG